MSFYHCLTVTFSGYAVALTSPAIRADTMATRLSAIPVLLDGPIAATNVVSLPTKITRMTTRAERCVLGLVGIGHRRRTIATMAITTGSLTSSMVTGIITAAVIVGVGIGAVIKRTLVCPGIRCMTGVTLYTRTCFEMSW